MKNRTMSALGINTLQRNNRIEEAYEHFEAGRILLLEAAGMSHGPEERRLTQIASQAGETSECALRFGQDRTADDRGWALGAPLHLEGDDGDDA